MRGDNRGAISMSTNKSDAKQAASREKADVDKPSGGDNSGRSADPNVQSGSGGKADVDRPSGGDNYGRSADPNVQSGGGGKADVDKPTGGDNTGRSTNPNGQSGSRGKADVNKPSGGDNSGGPAERNRPNPGRDVIHQAPPAPGGQPSHSAGQQPQTPRGASGHIPKARAYTALRETVPDYHRPPTFRPPVYHGGYYSYPSHPRPRPYHYGFWVFNDCGFSFCRRSVYFHFGYFPYVQVARLWTTPYVVVEYVNTPVVIHSGSGYYLEQGATVVLDNTLSDIRSAWTGGRLDLINKHVRADQKIAVILDGKYDYSIDPNDYVQMTSDAMDQIKTISFTWQTTRQRTDGDYTAFGKHTYTDLSGATKTVYVSYTLQNIGGNYVIVEVGSSQSPLI